MSLIAHWKLDGNLKDSSGYGHDLVMTSGSASYTTGVVTEKSWTGNGGTAYPYATGISMGTYATISWWEKTSATTDMSWAMTCSASSIGMNLYHNGIYTLNIGDGNDNPFQTDSGSNISVYTDNKWHHLAVTFNGSSKAKLYIDGIYKGTAKTYRNNTMSNARFDIGSWHYDTNYVWAGGINDVRVYDNVLSDKEIYDLSKACIVHYKFAERILPPDYTEVEYLESSGTQYIDTGFQVTSSNYNTLRFILDAKATSTSVGNRWWAHGLGGAGGATIYVGIGNGSSSNYPFTYGSGYTDISTSYYGQLGIRYRWDYDLAKKTYKVYTEDNRQIVNISNTSQGAFTSTASTATLTLFCWKYASTGNVGYYHSDKIYSYKLYENNILVRDMIPALNSSSVAGMYDFVTGTFYTNQGSGSFTYGKSLPSKYKKVNLSSTWYSYWNNSGTCTWNWNDTSISPKISGTTIYSATKGTAGNSAFCFGSDSGVNICDCGIITCSVWVYLSGTVSGDVLYMRSAQLDSNIGTLSYNGSTNPSTWGTGTWVRASWTGKLDSRTRDIYFCRYLNNAGEYMAVNGWQIEYGDKVTDYSNYTTTRTFISDSSGFDNYGQIRSTNCPSYLSTSRIGEGCFSFDGTEKYIQIQNVKKFYTQPWSFSAWVYREDSTRSVFLGNYPCTGNANIEMLAGGQVRVWWSGSPDYYVSTITLNDWTHIAVTNDLTNIKVFVNGTLVGSTTTSTTLATFPNELRIGADYRGGDSVSFKGKITDVRLYQSVLSADDIVSIYKVRGSIAQSSIVKTDLLVESVGDDISTGRNNSRYKSVYEYVIANPNTTATGYNLLLPGNKYTHVTADVTTKDIYGRTGWMCVASWDNACEWTKTSVSSSNPQGATPTNCISSNFGECRLHAFRILVSDAITNVGANATADFYFYWEDEVKWKNVWFPTAGSFYVDNARWTLKQFDFSYNLKFSYKNASHKWNRLSDYYPWNNCAINYFCSNIYGLQTTSYKALTTPGQNFGVYSCCSDGSLSIPASGNTISVTGQDYGSHNAKLGYDDGVACKVASTTATGAYSDTGDTSANGKKMWWFIL